MLSLLSFIPLRHRIPWWTLATPWLAQNFCNRFLVLRDFRKSSFNHFQNLGFFGQLGFKEGMFWVIVVRRRKNEVRVPECRYRRDRYIAPDYLHDAHTHHSQEYQSPDIWFL